MVWAAMMRAPEKMPAPPTPATARPAISAADDVAAAHTTEPSSKMAMADMKVHLTEKME